MTSTSGRFWSPDAEWNVPCGRPDPAFPHLDLDLTVTVAVDACAPDVRFLGPGRVAPFGRRRWWVDVDVTGRDVVSFEDGTVLHHDLDGVGWCSAGCGLVLERELLRGEVPHTVGLIGPPELYGLRLRFDRFDGRKVDAVSRTVGRALAEYGGVFVAIGDDGIVVRCEHSRSATAADPVGPVYRGIGIARDGAALALRARDLHFTT